ncbi:hypothetical protein [Streptomyces sp. NRRL B-24484]|uniref:hypothetical protein n=1 Tax=Streptomyces sp. NRRL B-24484 TaxID=1463833 RepID=UPI0004BF9284|nr:hypothetical protein [Streptomyces sp. NRRL B-24484]
MRVSGFDLHTNLGIQQAAQVFRDTSNSMFSGTAKLAANIRRFSGQMTDAQRINFFTPRDDDAFAALNEDKEDFAVGASIPKALGTGGGVVTIHLYVWDRGARRELCLRAPCSIGNTNATRRALETFVDTYRAEDPELIAHQI